MADKRCSECGKALSVYNKSGKCWCHGYMKDHNFRKVDIHAIVVMTQARTRKAQAAQ
jgi:hypothetical protein